MAKFSRSTVQKAEALRIRGEHGNSPWQTRMFVAVDHRNWLGSGDHLDHNANVVVELPLVSRGTELAVLTGAIDAARAVKARLC